MLRMLELKVVMLKRWISILSGNSAVAFEQGKGRIYSLSEVKGFYNDLTLKVGDGTDVDENGIPISLLGGGKHVYFPIAIFQYGLANYDLWLLTKELKYYLVFEKIYNWTLESQREDGSWNCFEPIGSKKYTVSSMGQGEGAAVLIRAFIENKNHQYLDAAKRAIDFMMIPIENGGTAYYTADNGIIFEEYAHKDRSTVLNGWIFSVFGLYDYVKVTEDNKYKNLLEKTVNSLKNKLPKYDMGYWSCYDLAGKVASPAYQKLHISLLDVMSEITGEHIFKEYSIKWNEYYKLNLNKYKAVAKKVIQKVFEKTDAVIIK